jgi:sporadic carbohydrate cluster 2OG-Fe(II) oxygenase
VLGLAVGEIRVGQEMNFAAGQIVRYDTGKYPFVEIITQRVNDHLAKKSAPPLTDLSLLHTVADRSEIAALYSAIYDLFLTPRFAEIYDALCKEIIETKFGGKAAYQRVPSARIQMPGQVSVSYHTDEWYGHGHHVQNFWLPLVHVSGTNSMFVADEATSLRITDEIKKTRKSIAEINQIARSVSAPLDIRFGDVFHFNSHVLHGSEINTTDRTRVSFDFRMLRDGDDRGLKD